MSSRSFKIISWNTGQFHRHNRPTWTLDASLRDIAVRVQRWSPDLLFLQEIRDEPQAQKLLSLLGKPWRFRLSTIERDRQIMVLSPHGEEDVRFGELHTPSGRSAMSAQIRCRPKPLHVVGCHGCAYHSSSRAVYFSHLVRALELASHEESLLLGDFNIVPALSRWNQDRFTLKKLGAAWENLLPGFPPTCAGLFALDQAWRLGGHTEARGRVIRGTWGFYRDHNPIEILV